MVRIPARRETLPVVGASVRHPDESGQAPGGCYAHRLEAGATRPMLEREADLDRRDGREWSE